MSERIYITKPGEPYMDALTVEAWLKGNTIAGEARSLLGARLMQRKEYRDGLVAEAARKRGISFEEMWDQILCGTAEPMSPEQYAKLKKSAAFEGEAEGDEP